MPLAFIALTAVAFDQRPHKVIGQERLDGHTLFRDASVKNDGDLFCFWRLAQSDGNFFALRRQAGSYST